MPQRSNIHGAEYTFLEWVPSLDDDKQYILYVDDAGHRVICSESLWNSGVWQEISASATALMFFFCRADLCSRCAEAGKRTADKNYDLPSRAFVCLL